MSRNLKRNLIVALILVLGILSLVGCSNNNEETKQEDSFEKLKEQGYITMGVDDTFAPMGFRDEKGEIVGFDIDLANEVSKRIGLDIKIQQIDWTMKETELNSGNIDVIWNGYSITDERKEKVAFSQPYLENRQVIVTLADTDINAKQDLAGKKVAAQNQSSAVEAMETEPELVAAFDGGEPVLFDTNNEAFMDLEAKRVDAVVADEVLAKYYIKQRGAERFKILEEDFGEEEYGIGFRKQDVKLLEAIDKALDDMKADGTYDEICQKWFAE